MLAMKRTILVFPSWSSNPYLTMLYLASQAADWDVAGATTLDALADAVDDLAEGDIVHVHWTAPVTSAATTQAEARRNLDRFRRVLDLMAEKGVQLLWTVHNEIAHDTAFYDVEREIARELAEHARLIIQLHELTAETVARSYDLPSEKIVTLRHSSYLGQYPDNVSEWDARERIGVAPGVPTVGFIGRVRPYKGLETLFAAVDRVASRVDGLTFVLAGKTSESHLAEVESALPRSVEIVRSGTFVPDDEIGLWLRASNVVVLPYRRVLNSGSAMLAATFDTPCIVPDDTPLARVYQGEPWVSVYETGGDQVANLADAIMPLVYGNQRAKEAAGRFARAYTPYDMSRDYLRILDRIAPVVTADQTKET
jgi:beta-1,4-mannosyltransferase